MPPPFQAMCCWKLGMAPASLVSTNFAFLWDGVADEKLPAILGTMPHERAIVRLTRRNGRTALEDLQASIPCDASWPWWPDSLEEWKAEKRCALHLCIHCLKLATSDGPAIIPQGRLTVERNAITVDYESGIHPTKGWDTMQVIYAQKGRILNHFAIARDAAGTILRKVGPLLEEWEIVNDTEDLRDFKKCFDDRDKLAAEMSEAALTAQQSPKIAHN
jgi:hypothetical protein